MIDFFFNIHHNKQLLMGIEFFKDPRALAEMIAKVFKLRLEGLVLKDVDVSLF